MVNIAKSAEELAHPRGRFFVIRPEVEVKMVIEERTSDFEEAMVNQTESSEICYTLVVGMEGECFKDMCDEFGR